MQKEESSTHPPLVAGRVARSTLVVVGGLAVSIVVGFIRQRTLAVLFGVGAELDAYTAANGIPELLFTMLSGGALAFAYIPVYTDLITRDDIRGGNTLTSQVINTIFLLTGTFALILALLAPTLVRVPWGIGPSFPAEIQSLTAQLMRVLLLSTVVFAVSSILTGTLHARQHFLLPAIAPTLYSGGIIFGALVLKPTMGIFGVAWGAVLGAMLHLLVQIPGIIRYGVRWRPTLDWRNPALQRVAILMAPRVIDLLMARISIDWISANLGSGLGEGRVSALRYAYSVMNTPWTLIGTAIGIAIFPTMAVLAAQQEFEPQTRTPRKRLWAIITPLFLIAVILVLFGNFVWVVAGSVIAIATFALVSKYRPSIKVGALRHALSGSLRAILTLALPAAVGLIVFGRSIIGILLEGGEFTSQDTELVYYALQFYAVALLSQSMLEVVVRAFAAQKDTYTPLFVSFFTTALNIRLAMWMSRSHDLGGFEHGGLALANGVAVGVEALIGLMILHILWRGIEARRILIDTGKAALAAAVMGGAILAYQAVVNPGRLHLVLVGGSAGVMIYFTVAYALGIKEIRSLPLALLRRNSIAPLDAE